MADLEWHDFGRKIAPKNFIVAPTLNSPLNGRPIEFLWRTATDFGFERPKIYRRTATNFRGEQPRTSKANDHSYNIIFKEIK